MRKVLLVLACVWLFAAFDAAEASTMTQDPGDAPVDVDAARDDGAACVRGRGHRGVRSALCRTAYTGPRACIYEYNIRAAALRHATGRRRLARVAVCTPSVSASAA